jgi:hypothetical protein
MAEKPLTKEDLMALSTELDLELKRTQIEEARMRLELTTIELEQHRNRKADLASVARDRFKQLSDQEERQRQRIAACPHRKGGMDLAGYRAGDDAKYAVFKHKWCNGDVSVICQRCSNIVIPPVEPMRVTLSDVDLQTMLLYGHKVPGSAGYFQKEAMDVRAYNDARKLYFAALKEYQFWLKMQTNNEPSESNQLKQISSSSDVFGFDRMYRLALHESLGVPIFQAQKWPGPIAAA